MNWRSRAERRANAIWRRRGAGARLLWPLAALYRLWRRVAAWPYRTGLIKPQTVALPVVVIGNLYVGGTGKTSLTIALARLLAARGWRPGIVARGHGARESRPRRVDPAGSAAQYGDEPLLMARATGMPVAVGHDRAAAARLLSTDQQCNLIVADDALQHYGLARDFEIALIDERGYGNGWLLPAGPLRDPPERLASVDAVVFNGKVPTVRVYSPFFAMTSSLGDAWSLAAPSQHLPLVALRREQEAFGLRILAACGIGFPMRFFAMLLAAGLECDQLPLQDHYPYADDPFVALPHDRILISEKDAVKCAAQPSIARDPRIWVVPLHAGIDPALADLIESHLRRPADGPPPA
jgi:tetraacyldisaccharide 4'-kinase